MSNNRPRKKNYYRNYSAPKNHHRKPARAMAQQQVASLPLAFPVQTATIMTANWRQHVLNANTNDPDHKFGFFIPKDDISSIVGVANAGIRVYFGLDTPGNLNTIRLFLVPTDAMKNDIVTLEGNSMVFDMTAPCPAVCGIASVLNTGPLGATVQGDN